MKPRPPTNPASEITLRVAFGREDLDLALSAEHYTPESLIEFFKNGVSLVIDEQTMRIFECQATSDLTLSEHSLRVLRRFEQYFANKPLPYGVDTGFFRLILALHDIGKPVGGSRGQHRYTRPLVRAFLQHFCYSDENINLALALLSKDPIGSHLRGDSSHKNSDTVVAEIKEMAQESGLPLQDFFELLMIYYLVDASSYLHLRSLFEFDDANQRLTPGPPIAARIAIIREGIKAI